MAKVVDISASRRIEVFSRLMEEMGRASDPHTAIELFARGMAEVYGPAAALHLSTTGLPRGAFRITRVETPGGNDDADLRESPWAARERPVHSGGVLAAVVAERRPAILHELDLSKDPLLAGLVGGGYRSLMAVPVMDPTLPVSWVVLLHAEPRFFSVEDLEHQIVRTNLLGAIVKGLWTGQQLAAANQKIAREIEQIARIQRTLLPSELPEIPGLALAAHYETFDRAGGDLYDFARLEGNPGTAADDRWAILIADASGHGPAAATVCAIVHSILHAYPHEPSGPAELLGHVNRHLCAKRIESSFVTAFLGFYQPSTRELVCARAGHNPPLAFGASGGAVRSLSSAAGLPLGIDADAPFSEERLTVAPGERVVLYTDGITEARDGEGAEFGVEGIERALAGCAPGPEAAVACLTEAVRKHLGAARATDDRTVLVLEGVSAGGEPRSPAPP